MSSHLNTTLKKNFPWYFCVEFFGAIREMLLCATPLCARKRNTSHNKIAKVFHKNWIANWCLCSRSLAVSMQMPKCSTLPSNTMKKRHTQKQLMRSHISHCRIRNVWKGRSGEPGAVRHVHPRDGSVSGFAENRNLKRHSTTNDQLMYSRYHSCIARRSTFYGELSLVQFLFLCEYSSEKQKKKRKMKLE